MSSSWLYWETGAVASTKGDTMDGQHGPRICPVLLNVRTSELAETPLAQYQASLATKEDLLLLIEALNDQLGSPQSSLELRGSFERNWEELDRELSQIRAMGLPRQVATLVTGIQKLQLRFDKEWASAESTPDNKAGDLLLTEIREELKSLVADVAERERHLCAEVDTTLYRIHSSSQKSHRNKEGKKIPRLFAKAVENILAAYE